MAFNPRAGFWDDAGALNSLTGSGFITGSRSGDGGDLVLRFNDGDASSTLTLRHFFWNNFAEGAGTGAGSSIGSDRLAAILQNVVEDGGQIASGASFLAAAHDYLLA